MSSPLKPAGPVSGSKYFLTIEEMFAGRQMTFEDIDHLSVEAFQTSKKKKGEKVSVNDSFQPSDVIDSNRGEESEDDEILQKFYSSSKKKGQRRHINPYLLDRQSVPSAGMDPITSYRDEYGLLAHHRAKSTAHVGALPVAHAVAESRRPTCRRCRPARAPRRDHRRHPRRRHPRRRRARAHQGR